MHNFACLIRTIISETSRQRNGRRIVAHPITAGEVKVVGEAVGRVPNLFSEVLMLGVDRDGNAVPDRGVHYQQCQVYKQEIVHFPEIKSKNDYIVRLRQPFRQTREAHLQCFLYMIDDFRIRSKLKKCSKDRIHKERDLWKIVDLLTSQRTSICGF